MGNIRPVECYINSPVKRPNFNNTRTSDVMPANKHETIFLHTIRNGETMLLVCQKNLIRIIRKIGQNYPLKFERLLAGTMQSVITQLVSRGSNSILYLHPYPSFCVRTPPESLYHSFYKKCPSQIQPRNLNTSLEHDRVKQREPERTAYRK